MKWSDENIFQLTEQYEKMNFCIKFSKSESIFVASADIICWRSAS